MRSARTYDWDEIERLTKKGRSIAQIAELVGCHIRTVERVRRRRKIAGPQISEALAPREERLAFAERLIEDGASLTDVAVTTHISFRLLKEMHPDKLWTREQTTEAAHMSRALSKIKPSIGTRV